MTDKLILSWQDIETSCKILGEKIKSPVNLIVAIAKGGLPIATILANKYLQNPPIITLQLKEISSEGRANYQAKKVKLVSSPNQYPIKHKRVLIIDDIVDTSNTLKEAIKQIKIHQPKSITTATIHYKPRAFIKPDIFVKKIDNHIWTVYPWE